jgi:NAD(P)-dependent dehydrogenase (short-subunit alcohol dehydrogenase family)
MVALVTGASRGLGAEVALQLAARGCHVVAGARDVEAGERVLGTTRGIDVRRLDVTDERSAADLCEGIGRLDILVNNAGGHYDAGQELLAADLGVAAMAFEANTLGAWRMCIACAGLLRRSDRGRIVNVSAGAGTLERLTGAAAGVRPGHTPAYTVSKAALNALTLMLAEELRDDGVLVNAVNPGWRATALGGPAGGPVEEGARGVVAAALLPAGGPTGRMLSDGRVVAW